ncbi:MAG: Lrp/AsnC family transcriptional regulator [Candidatus Korarchaeum sp.]
MSRLSGRGEFDDTDLEILRLMQRNARTPYSEIAKKLGIPEATVKYRVRKLIERGIVRGFYTLLDPDKVGFPFSLIILVDALPEELDEVFDHVRGMREAAHVFKVTGKYNVVAIFHARDMDHVSRISESVRSLRGVASAETLLVTGVVHMNLELPI